MALAALSFEFGILGDFANEFLQADRNFLHGLIAALKPRNGEQSPDQLVQTIGFELNALQRALSFGSTALAAWSQRNIQSRQGRTRLVRTIIHNSRLGFHGLLRTVRHCVAA